MSTAEDTERSILFRPDQLRDDAELIEAWAKVADGNGADSGIYWRAAAALRTVAQAHQELFAEAGVANERPV